MPHQAEIDLINERRRIRNHLRHILSLILSDYEVQRDGIEKSCLSAIEKLERKPRARKRAAKKTA
jgi:hypothetical protein